MITATDSLPTDPTASSGVRSLLGNRRGLLVLGAVALGLGFMFKWNWLVAAGIAPLLLTALPCVAMCALGLCMSKMIGGSFGSQSSASDTTPGAEDPLLLAASSDGSENLHPIAAAPVAPVRSADRSCCHNPQKRRNHHA